MRRAVPFLIIAAACGPKPPPESIGNSPTSPAGPACADAGAILRGPLVTEDAKAGPARELAIANACRDDKWSAEVLDCITSSRSPQKCVEKLSKPQQLAYQTKLDTWSAKYGGDAYGGDMYGGGMDGGDITPAYVDCADVVGDPGKFSPALDAKSPEHDWDVMVRRRQIVDTCNAEGWEESTKTCIESATDESAVEGCLHDEASRPLLAKQLVDIDKLAGKIAAAKKKPASIDCTKVVGVQYADAKWKDKLPNVKPADRKKQIADSRKLMTKACTTEKWADTLRACIVVGGGESCFENGGINWGFPAAGIGFVMPPACELYQQVIGRIAGCDKIPQATRDALQQAFDQTAAAWQSVPAEGRAALESACQAAASAVVQVGSTGC